jgi:GGDEF domain-containing protein
MSGLPEVLFPGMPVRLVMLLKASLGPMAGGIAVYYLGIWLGGAREDTLVYRLTAWGGSAVFIISLGLAAWAAVLPPADFHGLLWVTAAVNMTAALLGLAVTIRASLQGDPLARWMVLACLSLTATVAGLYLRGLNVPGFGLGTWVLTAVFTIAYYIIATKLIIQRLREGRQLARLASLEPGIEPATGLPTGSVLLSKVEHAFWRTARTHGECTVMCIFVRNLYELGETAGHGVEHQILASMAARIRRAAGFRCVVGLLHPRCFVVVISADKHREFVPTTVARVRALVSRPMTVVGSDQAHCAFTPRLGVGVVTFDPTNAKPMDVLNEVERQAQASVRTSKTQPEDEIVTAPAPLH